MLLKFEWNPEKEQVNLAKHGIDFDTASNVFYDNNRVEKYDEIHSINEDRYITIGEINGTAFAVTVVYTVRKPKIRIISARKATKKEREEYYANYKNY